MTDPSMIVANLIEDDQPRAAEPLTDAQKLAELEHNVRFWGIIELAVRNSSVMDYMRHWEGRAEKAEALVASQAKRIEEQDKALAFADEQAAKREALLEPHIKWDDK